MTPRTLISIVALSLLTSALAVKVRGVAQYDNLDLVDAKGNIRKPADHRDRYQTLGVYTVLDPKGNEMHYTYAAPGTAESYRKNKKFADGTVLVKEVMATNHAKLTTGDAHWAEFYRKNGRFADGTVLVKEVMATNHAKLTTGDAHWAEGTKVWFVMMKDDKGRYPGNPLWGDGWGWALYKSDAPNTQVATDYKKDCLGCHIPAKETDWVYVRGYPALGAK